MKIFTVPALGDEPSPQLMHWLHTEAPKLGVGWDGEPDSLTLYVDRVAVVLRPGDEFTVTEDAGVFWVQVAGIKVCAPKR